MAKRRILYADSNSTMKGGGQVSLVELARLVDRSEFELFAITGGEGELATRLRQIGVHVFHVALPTAKSWRVRANVRRIREIQNLIRQHNIDIVHSNNTRAHLFCGIAARRTNTACIFHYRVSYSDGIWDRLLPLLATRIVAASESIARRFSTRARKKLRIVYNAVDTERFARRKSELRVQLSLGEDTFVIGTCGRLSEEKGIDAFLRVAEGVATRVTDCHAIVVGSGDCEYEEHLQHICEDHGITDRVHFIPSMDDMPQFYSSIDAYCLFSVNEGFNRTIIESMSVGCPVVASDVGGNPEAIRDGETGYLIPPGQWEMAIEKLLLLAETADLGRRIGLAASTKVAESFSLTQQSRAVRSLYRDLLT